MNHHEARFLPLNLTLLTCPRRTAAPRNAWHDAPPAGRSPGPGSRRVFRSPWDGGFSGV